MYSQGNTAQFLRTIPSGTLLVLASISAVLVVTIATLYFVIQAFNNYAVLFTSAVWLSCAVIVLRYIRFHEHSAFGNANGVTTARAAISALLAGCIPVSDVLLNNASTSAWVIALVATFALCLDGLDGYLARKHRMSSVFGARFDMETDAFLALVIALLLWMSGKVGVWVLGLGVLRYAFVFASIKYEALQGDLFYSMRRKVVCVIQVGALCLMLFPWVSATIATLCGSIALLCLIWSFAIDVVWLFKNHPAPVRPSPVTNGESATLQQAPIASRVNNPAMR